MVENCKALYKYQNNFAASKPKDYSITSNKVPYEYNPTYFQLELNWTSWEDGKYTSSPFIHNWGSNLLITFKMKPATIFINDTLHVHCQLKV